MAGSASGVGNGGDCVFLFSIPYGFPSGYAWKRDGERRFFTIRLKSMERGQDGEMGELGELVL